MTAMRAETPRPRPVQPPRPHPWADLAMRLRAQEGQWFNVTDDLRPAFPDALGDHADAAHRRLVTDKLAKSINGGNRSAFRPVGGWVAHTDGTDLWIVAVPLGQDPATYLAMIPTAQES